MLVITIMQMHMCKQARTHAHMHARMHTCAISTHQSSVSSPYFHSYLVNKAKMAAHLLAENLLKGRQSNTKNTIQFRSHFSYKTIVTTH